MSDDRIGTLADAAFKPANLLRTSIVSLVSLGALLTANYSALALEPEDVLYFRYGPLTLRPQFGTSEVYNDNIFYTHANTVADFTTVLSPGLKLQLGRPEENYISLGYNMDQLFYADRTDLNTQQHYFDIRDQLKGEHLSLVGSDRIQLLSSPLGGVVERVGPGGTLTAVGQNVDRLGFDDVYTLSYNVSEKTAVYLRGNHNSVDYLNDIALYDIETLTGTGGFAYRAFQKVYFFGEVYYGQTSTEPNVRTLARNADLDFVGGYAGARGNFTEKLSGTAKVGYESREFKDGTSVPSEPVADVSVTQQFSEKQALTLSYSRQNSVSVQYTRQTYTADSFGLLFVQTLGPSHKWQANVAGTYTMYSYEQTGGLQTSSEYNYLRASVGLTYQIQKWLAANLGYEYERVRGDSTAVIDYDVNRVSLRVNVGF